MSHVSLPSADFGSLSSAVRRTCRTPETRFRFSRWVVLAAILLTTAIGLATPAFAGAGQLDTTFNSTGMVLTDFHNSSQDRGAAVVLDSSGRIVVAGFTDAVDARGDFAVARYNADGSLDTTFGSNGKVVTDFGGSDSATGIAIDSSGRILVVGSTDAQAKHSFCREWALARYNSDGTLDTSFGTNGLVITDFSGSGASEDEAAAVTTDANGNVVVAGRSDSGGKNWDFAVARYTPSGSLDTTFGSGGKVLTDFGASGIDIGLAVALDSNGRIVVAGVTEPSGAGQFALARYDASGNLDSTFGSGGLVVTSFNDDDDGATALRIDSQGKILAAGHSGTFSSHDFALVRYNPSDGSLDKTFGFEGTQTTDFGGDDIALGVALDSQGRIVAIGSTEVANSLQPSFALARYTPTGILDTTFGNGGLVVTNFGSNVYNSANGVAIDNQDRIIAAGQSAPDINTVGDFALARYKGEVRADLSITKSGSPNPVIAGNNVTYTMNVTNLGPDDADKVVVTDNLPTSLSFVSCGATNSGVCAVSGNNVTVSFATLADGDSATVTLIATVKGGTAGGTAIVNTATVGSNDTDPNNNNNTATSTVTVLGTADLAVGEVVTKNSNRQLTYSLSTQNLGPDPGTQVVLTDVIPSNARFVSVSPGAWSCSTPPIGGVGTLTCTLSSLTVNQTQHVIMTLKASNGGNVSITNTVSVSASSFDPYQANNSATLITHVNGK